MQIDQMNTIIDVAQYFGLFVAFFIGFKSEF